MTTQKEIIGYLDKQDLENWGDKLCNAYCMPCLKIKPYGDANIKVRMIMIMVKEREK